MAEFKRGLFFIFLPLLSGKQPQASIKFPFHGISKAGGINLVNRMFKAIYGLRKVLPRKGIIKNSFLFRFYPNENGKKNLISKNIRIKIILGKDSRKGDLFLGYMTVVRMTDRRFHTFILS